MGYVCDEGLAGLVTFCDVCGKSVYSVGNVLHIAGKFGMYLLGEVSLCVLFGYPEEIGLIADILLYPSLQEQVSDVDADNCENCVKQSYLGSKCIDVLWISVDDRVAFNGGQYTGFKKCDRSVYSLRTAAGVVRTVEFEYLVIFIDSFLHIVRQFLSVFCVVGRNDAGTLGVVEIDA